MTGELSHLDDQGRARMVDVSGKPVTRRTAVATAMIRMAPSTAQALVDGQLPKGDAVAVARVAGIMAAKRTPELIPLCHPVALTSVTVDIDVDAPAGTAQVTVTTTTTDATGVEMEALVAAGVAAFTIYDMIKGVERGATVEHVRVDAKTGGVHSDWSRA